MFKIVPNARAWWPVKWPGVTEEGEIVENRIEMRFLIHKVDAAVGIIQQASELQAKAREEVEAGQDLQASRIYAEATKLFAVDFRGVGLENGELLRWSDENLTLLMNEPGVFEAVQEAYRECRAAGAATRAGN